MTKHLAALVGSRICHDLISPIGAIGNGVELLSLADGDSKDVMNLITQSIDSATARIRFFRIAFGGAVEDQNVSRSEVLSILSASAVGGRYTYSWRVEADQSRLDVRVAFLLMQCMEGSMPFGGDISIRMSKGKWIMTATSDRLNIDRVQWIGITNGDAKPYADASQVQFALLPAVLEEAGRSLTVDFADTTITAEF